MKNLILLAILSFMVLSTSTQAANEGIQVHGHWTFKIYNPDGSLDRKVNFENALAGSGAIVLFELLSGKSIFDNAWEILIGSSIFDGPCDSTSGSSTPCYITSGTGTENTFQFYGLTYQVNNASTKLILKGDFTASYNSSIGIVQTRIVKCFNSSTMPQSGCSGTGDLSVTEIFTEKNLTGTNIIPINQGQLVQVIVEISFS